MNILFRADSSSIIGTGHIMRDLVLAKKYMDANITFASQNLDGNINHKVVEAGYKVKLLNSNDVDKLIKLVKKLKIDLVVIDSYDIDYKYEKKLKKATKVKILSFDDTYQKHHCDILLNHNIYAKKKKYKNLVPKKCEIRCGIKYTLLRDEFIEAKKFIVFVAMGGADSANLNIKIIKSLKKLKNIELNIVTTDANKNLKNLKSYVKSKKWIKLHINSKKIAQLIAYSNFSIITPSVVANEVVFMGKPLVAIKVAKNQKNMAKYLKKSGYTVLKIKDIYKLKKVIKQCKQKN